MQLAQYGRVVSAIEVTMEDLRRGPRPRRTKEGVDVWKARVDNYYLHKHKFVLFAIRCLKQFDEDRARRYLHELRRWRESL